MIGEIHSFHQLKLSIKKAAKKTVMGKFIDDFGHLI